MSGRWDMPRWLARVNGWDLAIYAGAAALSLFAFAQSYRHIYDLGRTHHQDGWTATMLPLSVDVLIVVATAVVLRQRYLPDAERPDWHNAAYWVPRVMLYAGIVATIGANLLDGLPYGWVTAGISTWPGVVFAGVIEMLFVTARHRSVAAPAGTSVTAGQSPIPASAAEAAKTAYAASVAGGNPLTPWQLHTRYSIPRKLAEQIAPKAAVLNGASGDE